MRLKWLHIIIVLGVILLMSACNFTQLQNRREGMQIVNEATAMEQYILDGKFTNNSPTLYELSATVNLHSQNNIDHFVYEVWLKNPTVALNNIRLSYMLDPMMQIILHTDRILVTSDEDAVIHLAPDGEANGTSLAKAFTPAISLLNKDTLKVYQNIYVKLTYDLNEIQQTEYFFIKAVPTKGVVQYLANSDH